MTVCIVLCLIEGGINFISTSVCDVYFIWLVNTYIHSFTMRCVRIQKWKQNNTKKKAHRTHQQQSYHRDQRQFRMKVLQRRPHIGSVQCLTNWQILGQQRYRLNCGSANICTLWIMRITMWKWESVYTCVRERERKRRGSNQNMVEQMLLCCGVYKA